MVTGERDLDTLLSSLSPLLMGGEYIFCCFPGARYGEHPELEPVAACLEAEGLTLIVPRLVADEHGLSYQTVFRGITLHVHSSLEAVGLTAAMATKLAEYGISANVVAGYFHDHIFVPSEDAEKAVAALHELSG